MSFVFPPSETASVAVRGDTARFPVHRIYCVGRNFAEHAREMGAAVERGTPTIFCKPADAVVCGGGDVPYPTLTQDLHHEAELVVALGRDADGEIAADDALDHVYGYTVGLDLTRRDLQAALKAKSLPWDVAKAFDASAPVGEIARVTDVGHPRDQVLSLSVNGERRQQAPLSDMIFGVAEIIVHLSRLFRLRAGDLVFMGTPSGVAALVPGDAFEASVAGIATLRGRIVAR